MDLFKNLSSIQKTLQESQEKLGTIRVVGTAGGDMVAVELSGTMELTGIKISPEAVDPEDVDMLQDLIVAAFRDANAKLKERLQQEAGSLGNDFPFLKGMV
ncbi:YbaB/EbfC family nucleoid-associated protein [Spirochaeta lutea]|nr:YbaB/EbfC family nucleoid-associated protein [Spirochaeta lutea]